MSDTKRHSDGAAPRARPLARRLAELAMWVAALAVVCYVADRRFNLLDRFRTPPAAVQPTVRVGEHSFRVELVTNDDTRRAGLSKRASIDADTGMLFVYPQEHPAGEPSSFWMKDCWVDIDIAFIGADRRIVTTYTMKAEPPGTGDSVLKRYPPSAPWQFALEVRAGELNRRGIKVGDKVEFSRDIEAAIPRSLP
ncbi:MAG: DUF192 domain-containing protein [Phycisphaerae bacterium]|nr:DUF192 domain-containing protein [Phycisphaerae bacterium]